MYLCESKYTCCIVFFGLCCKTILGSALWCYQCVSTQPGCGTPFNWLWHWTKVCPEDNDVCVKIIEEKDGSQVITRDCLSSMQGLRTDIPADHYEGCRPAAVDVKLANYCKSLLMTYYEKTTWCFCFLDHRCNNAIMGHPSVVIIIFASLLGYLLL
ncbi:hypothetical protein NQ318_016213 [Aromia moschata]|uniref:Protein sleepless n=1 Tax=Aromia moschata TaxID=1265417 RepID=A0AAV8YEE0_9CUCU|nr:hypothetical protein NQ318_016213 [Aromia moschata]